MNLDAHTYRTGVVKPMACLREGWQLIKHDYWIFLGITLVGMLISGVAAVILMGPVMCGIHYCYLRQERGHGVAFGMLFRGFDYFVPSLIATLIVTAIMIVPMILMMLGMYAVMIGSVFAVIAAQPERMQDGAPQPPDPVWFLIPMAAMFSSIIAINIVAGILQAFFIFVYPLIVDRRMTGGEAVKLSAKAVLGNFLGVAGLCILIQFIGTLGVLLCFFGVYLTLPLSFAMITVAYRQVFGIEPYPYEVESEPLVPALPGPPQTGIQAPSSTSVTQ